MKKNALIMGISALSFLFSSKVFAQVPVAGFSVDQSTVCQGVTVQITDLSTDTPIAWSYTIDGAASTETVQNPAVTFTAPGIYNITLVATNVNGDSSPFSGSVAVNALPSVTTGTDAAICAGDFITLSGSGASTYTWTGGAIDGVSFAPTSNAVYTVTGTDANGCKNSAIQSVTVNSLPVLSVSGATGVCLGSVVTLTASGADAYSWSAGSGSDVLTDSPLATTIYTLSGTNTVTGCSNTLTRSVAVNSLPIVAVNNGTICSGDVFVMTATGASTYVFSSGGSSVTPSTNSSYTVTGTDLNGCIASAVSDVTVFTIPVITVNSGTMCAGSVFTLVPSGALTYTYSSTTATVSPLSNTSYSINGTDANGCVSNVAAVADLTVMALPVVSVNSGSVCSGNVFTMIPSGASIYFFSAGSSTVAPTANTVYTVTGTDANGCVSAGALSSVSVAALPVVSVNSGTICAGSAFTMISSGASTYSYSNGSSTVNPLVTTSYSVTGISAQGCLSSNTAVSTVTVFALPVVSVTSGTICQGGIYTMTASGASSYTFSSSSAVVIPMVTTSYSVTGVSANGCAASNTAVATITVLNLPVIAVTGNTAICSGGNATLTATGASSYVWNTTATTSAVVLSPLANTVYTVLGTDANGCVGNTTYSIAVNALPVISVNSGAVCPGGSFTLSPAGAVTYTFSGGSLVVSPGSTSMYSVTGTDANGCVSAIAAVSTVSVVNTLVITVSGNTTICNGQTANLTASGANTYSWSTSASGSNIALNPASTTVYTVTGISSNCSNTAVVSVSVNALPSVNATSSSTTICAGESVTITASGASTYTWNDGTNAASFVSLPASTISYTLTGVDANGCVNSAVLTQSVSDCTGLTSIEANTVAGSIYPNPTIGEFTLKLNADASVKVLNGIGQVVYSALLLQGENSLSVTNQPKGMYFVQIKQGESIKTLKFVKN